MNVTQGIAEQIVRYLFTDVRGTSTEGKKNFDHNQDYRYIVPSFMQLYGINLERDDITWYEYKTMLEGCFLNPCTLSKVIGFRTMELPKDSKGKADILDIKAKYRLKSEDSNGIGSLFNSLKGVANNGG